MTSPPFRVIAVFAPTSAIVSAPGSVAVALRAEFHAAIDAYLATAAPQVRSRTLADLVAFNAASRLQNDLAAGIEEKASVGAACAFFSLDVGIRALRGHVGAITGRIWWCGDEDGHKLHSRIFSGENAIFKAWAKAHVDVPFVGDLKGFHPSSDRVHGEGLEVGFPDWIAGEGIFIMTAQPLFKLSAAVLGHDFDAVMHDTKTHAFSDQSTQGLQMCSLNGWVAFSAVCIDHHGICIGKGGFIFDPAHFMTVHDQIRHRGEAFFQQQTAGLELMHSWWM